MIFIVTLCGLILTAIILFNRAKKTELHPTNLQFEKLQRSYLTVYCLATFSDWLQGPYIYKLYSDYGYEEEEIAVLYIAGFASSSLFGTFVGHIADKYGRKMLCISYGFFYSLCCLTKISSDFYTLLFGRILGGISTSILCSTFEAWYINEHVNRLGLNSDWLNITFSMAGFYTGFLAIVAGIVCQIFAEGFNLGSQSPFILAIPFLLTSSYIIYNTWTEDLHPLFATHHRFIAPLYLIFVQNPMLLILGLIQSMFEAVMYTFIFSWTPIITNLNPPLGVVFASFMLAFMIGSKIYSLLLSDRLRPQMILVLTSGLSFFSFSTVALVISYILYTNKSIDLLTNVCFLCFVLYEISLGLYVPVMGYLKGLVVPEEYRASISNWFRVPMNIFTCISLTLNRVSNMDDKESGLKETNVTESDVTETDVKEIDSSIAVFRKFQIIYLLCSLFLLFTLVASVMFKKIYTRRYFIEESLSVPIGIVAENDSLKDKSLSS
uniref:Molybdate-anion transporter n=1 Tax=Graphocephala atropunctata TaxID=36148 RepID=A0A1B6KYB1_9HEMI